MCPAANQLQYLFLPRYGRIGRDGRWLCFNLEPDKRTEPTGKRGSRDSQKANFRKSIKDYLDLRLTNLNMKIDHLKEDIARLEKEEGKGKRKDEQ